MAAKLGGLANMAVEMVSGLAPELEPIVGGIKTYCKYYEGYVYFVLEVDNPLVDSVIHFFNEVRTSLFRLSRLFLLNVH